VASDLAQMSIVGNEMRRKSVVGAEQECDIVHVYRIDRQVEMLDLNADSVLNEIADKALDETGGDFF
jgi:hypothetical protein